MHSLHCSNEEQIAGNAAFSKLVSSINDAETEVGSTLDVSSRASGTRQTVRVRPMTWATWLFDFQLHMPKFSDLEEVRVACCHVLDDANKKISYQRFGAVFFFL